MESSSRKQEPVFAQVYLVSLAYGLPIFIFCGWLFGIELPISAQETAQSLFPKLAQDYACLQGHMSRDAINQYILTYANLAVILSLIGFVAGLLFNKYIGQAKPELAAPNYRIKQNPLKSRFEHYLGLLGVLVLTVGFVVLILWLTFWRSSCGRLQAGWPLHRSYDGIHPTLLMFGLSFLLGLVAGQIYRRSVK